MKKYELLKFVAKGVKEGLIQLEKVINPTIEPYKEIINWKGRYTKINKDFDAGKIKYSDQIFEINRIRIGLIEFIDRLEDKDFKPRDWKDKNKVNNYEEYFNHFWKPFFDNRTTIVIGTYYQEKFRNWEASTLMATGDGIALGKIMGILNNVGVKDIDVIPTYNFTGDRYQDNLVLLGGPDANELTKEVYSRMVTNFKFGNPDINEIALYDSKKNKKYFPKHNQSGEVIGDYGLTIKAQNPFNNESCVIISAGCWGFGTCAASQIFESPKLIEKIEGFNDDNGFEVLVYSDIIKDWTQKPKIIDSYKFE